MDTGTDLELFKAKVQAELNRLEAQSSAKEVAGKARRRRAAWLRIDSRSNLAQGDSREEAG